MVYLLVEAVYSLVDYYVLPAVFLASRWLLFLLLLRLEPLPRGCFARPDSCLVPDVVVAVLALEVDGLDLGAVGALSLVEVAFLALPSLLSAARPLHIRVHVAAACALSSASWAPTTGGASPGLAQ